MVDTADPLWIGMFFEDVLLKLSKSNESSSTSSKNDWTLVQGDSAERLAIVQLSQLILRHSDHALAT
jgi:hypothetical protein